MGRYSRVIATILVIVLIAWIAAAVRELSNAQVSDADVKTARSLFDSFFANPLLFTGALGALGTLTMAVVQTMKDLVPFLRWYQEINTRHWLRIQAGEAAAVATGPAFLADPQFSAREFVKKRLAGRLFKAEVLQVVHPPFDKFDEALADEAEADLIRLATAGNRNAFYDLPIEKLCGQMNAAAQVVLDSPDQHAALFICLASLAAPEERSEFADRTMREELAGLQHKSPRSTDEEHRIAEIQQQLTDVRGRIANQIHRSVDGFQIGVGDQWQWYLRTASFLVSFIITTGALQAGVVRGMPANYHWAEIVLFGLMGGFLAPVASDIQAIVRQFRQAP